MAHDAQGVRLFLRVGERLGTPITDPVLDFGCGQGGMVHELAAQGLDTYGCDFADVLGDDPRLAAIEVPYRLPYPDNSFKTVLSAEVFEHVQDYPQAFCEIRRVLRPGGFSLNIFPSRYTPLEPHAFVPFATVIHSRWWLLLWARLGVRNSFQHGISPSETASRNERFLRDETNYLPTREILRLARQVFPGARFLPSERLAASARLHPLARFPSAGHAYAAFRSRTLLLPG